MNLTNRSFLKLLDYTPEEIEGLLDLAADLKAKKKAGIRHDALRGKNIALIFEKTSTRTRCSFEVAAHDLGMEVTYLDPSGSQIGKKESIADTARVLGRYYDCVVWRTYRQSDLEEFAEFAGVPVINGLTDYAHPCQVLADLMTIRERRGALAGQKLCFVGDGSNMANSLIVGGLLSGMKVDCVCPHGYRPAADVLMFAHKYGSAFRLLEDPAEGVKDADVVVTAVWNTAAPGTSESESRLRDFAGFQLTGGLLKAAKPDCMVLHCLPAHRGEEISTAVFEVHADEIFTEAENRLHVQKAVLAVLLAGK
jgi:ornithine carbamoyltransferase